MPKYVFRKLVRDGLPAVYKELNQKPVMRVVKGDELWKELKRKFLEETSELPDDISDKDKLTGELADLLRIIKDAAKHAGVDMAEIEAADTTKTAKRGGFLDGVYVESLELSDTDGWNDYYRKEPARFPEITSIKPAVEPIIVLSEQLAELGKIDRATLLPGGRRESDSHHSFSLALIAYDVCTKHAPELDVNLVVRYALVHGLLEIVTGDEDTLLLDKSALHAKHQREQNAIKQLRKRLKDYPALLQALKAYETFDSPEAAAVYTLDKACTIWTHFWDRGESLHLRGAKTRADIDTWYEAQIEKLHSRLKIMPPQSILDIFESSYQKMRTELFLG